MSKADFLSQMHKAFFIEISPMQTINNIVIHDAIEGKNFVSKNVFSAEIKQDDAA